MRPKPVERRAGWDRAQGAGHPWKLLNGTGQPAMGASLNVEDGSYNLDTGNYLGPAAEGWLVDLYPKPPMKLGEYAFMSVRLHFGPLGHNFSLVTELDNVYDGVEARRAVGKDRNGRHIGGEDEDYGNLIGPLGPFLRGLYDKLIAGSSQ